MKTSFCIYTPLQRIFYSLTILLFIIFSNQPVFGQNDSITHSIGVEGSIYYGYRNLILNDPTYTELFEFREAYEVPARGYAAGLKYRYQYNSKIGFETGLSYNIRGYDASESNSFQDSDLFGGNAQYFYFYNYLDVPLLLNYHLSHLRYNLFTSFGVSTNFLLSAKERAVIVYSDNSISDETNTLDASLFNRVNVQGIFRFGIDYTPEGPYTFRIVPIVQYSINDLTQNERFNEHLFAVGLNVGVFLNF